MIEVKGFAGILDSDNPPTSVPNGFHTMANNGRFKGVNGLLRYENFEGTRLISYNKPAGINECIGSYYDAVNKLIYSCYYNSNSNHYILEFDIAAETFTRILQSNTNTQGDILNFNLNNPIHSMDLIYGSEGNFLCFVDSLGRPTKIDLNLFKNNPYSVTKRNFIDVAKAPFVMPPKVSYENDENATTNNLRNSLFQFRVRPIYDDNTKSVSSSGSEVPLPYLPFDQNINKDVTKNARICVYVQTGDVNVKAIQIEGRQASDNFTSDWFKIEVLDKKNLSIADNTIYRYLFLNDSVYPTLSTEGTDPNTQVLQLQDYVPQQTNTQCLLNGNVLGYAGITEGYDKIDANMDIVSVVEGNGRVNNKNGILFFAAQNSLASIGSGNQIIIYLSGVGDNDNTTDNPITLSNSQNTKFDVKAIDNLGADKSFFYLESTANQTIANILAGISTAAQAKGYTQVSIGANQLVLSLTNVVLQSSQTYTTSPSDTNEAVYAVAQRASYAIGVQYFDEKGRTNGVVYAASYNTQPSTSITNPFELRIFHRPPLWATYYHVVRSKNTTYSKLLTWVTDAAFSNQSSVDSNTYAYLGITSIKEYNEEILSSSGVVSYEFNKGDRIRFIERELIDGTTDSTGFANLDYEVLGTVPNPIVNGIAKSGTFIKILYPSSDISADFKLNGSDGFQNYKIVLYGLATKTSPENQIYYECGLQYGIGNAGTNLAYHAGMVQSQTSNLSQPAIIILDKGDLFFRYRNVVSGNNFTATAGGNQFSDQYATARIKFPNDVTNTQYEIRSNEAHPASLVFTSYPAFADTDYEFYNKTANTVNIRIKATINFKVGDDTDVSVYLKQVDATGTNDRITTVIDSISIAQNQYQQVVIDGVYLVDPNSKVWVIIGNSNSVYSVDPQVYSFDLTVLLYKSISIVEYSFSDLYNLQLSANSRPTAIDENAEQVYYPTRFRWGLSYLQDTNINNINRFYPANYDEWDRSKGDVRRLVSRERLLKVFQAKGVGQTGIYTKFVQDSGGTNILTTTDDIITKNNINYYQGEYGMGNYPTSLVSTDAIDIFVDPLRGYQIISDPSGLRAINELYLGQYYIRGLLTNYAKQWTKPDGSIAKIMGVYNYIDEEYNCILEGGSNGDTTISNYNFSFNLKRKGYSSFFDLHPEWSISANEKIYAWKDGDLYAVDNRVNYCNYFGVQYDCNITLPFNEKLIEKKGWQGIVEQANTIWNAPEIYSQVNSYGAVVQESNLIQADFRYKEGMFHASFLRDINSIGGISRGDRLKGTFIVIKLQPTNSSNFVFLASVITKYLNSPLVPS